MIADWMVKVRLPTASPTPGTVTCTGKAPAIASLTLHETCMLFAVSYDVYVVSKVWTLVQATPPSITVGTSRIAPPSTASISMLMRLPACPEAGVIAKSLGASV